MKKGTMVRIAVLASAFMFCIGVVAFGASMNTDIKAILSKEIKIRYSGAVQEMKDASGNAVYPILYNGTTYIPVRSVSNIMNIPINWDGDTKTVIIGTEEKQPKSILSFKSKTSNHSSKVSDKGSLTVKGEFGADIKYNDGISYELWNADWSASVDGSYKAEIGGTYNKLSFDADIAPSNEEYKGKTFTIFVYNVDTGETLANIKVVCGEIKKVEDIDITGVKTLGFAANGYGGSGNQGFAYFFNPTVK
ncbi:MAG: stalk domain-containing protein [Bacillota bacterium]|nr:stalk domain-containing protein [Bacillota bacterium]